MVKNIKKLREEKNLMQKVQLVFQLEEEDKRTMFRIIDRMLTKNRFQTFYEQNIQTAK